MLQQFADFYRIRYFHFFNLLKDVSRDPQLQIGENYSYMFNLGWNISKSWLWFIWSTNKRVKPTMVVLGALRVKHAVVPVGLMTQRRWRKQGAEAVNVTVVCITMITWHCLDIVISSEKNIGR